MMNQNPKAMKLIRISLFLALMFNAALAQETEKLNVLAANGLNMRSKPDIHSRVVTKIPYGKSVEVIDVGQQELQVGWVKGHWHHVRYRGREGYVFGGYLSVFNPPQEMKSNNLSDLLLEYCEQQWHLVKEPVVTLEMGVFGDTITHTLKHYENDAELELEREADRTSCKLILNGTVEEIYVLLEAILNQAEMRNVLDGFRYVKNATGQLSRITTADRSVEITAYSETRSYVYLATWNEPN